MRCASCEVLKVQLAEAREELAAWAAYDASGGSASVSSDLDRLMRWGEVFSFGGYGGRLMLMLLADRRGRVVTRDQLLDATRASPQVDVATEVTSDIVGVLIAYLRRGLKQMGREGRLPRRFAALDGGITTVWGVGFRMDLAEAEAILACAGEVAA